VYLLRSQVVFLSSSWNHGVLEPIIPDRASLSSGRAHIQPVKHTFGTYFIGKSVCVCVYTYIHTYRVIRMEFPGRFWL